MSDPPAPGAPSAPLREREHAEVLAALAARAGPVYVHGPGGVGKSWLARQVTAARVAAGDEVVWASLEAARSEEAALRLLARALDLPGEGATDATTVGRALRGRGPVLVVLDGAEGALAEGGLEPLLDAWRAQAPEARWLITTRVALQGTDARRVALLPFATRRVDAEADSSRAGLSEAARFLLALLERRGMPTPESERADLEKLCAHVDGLALALELLAPRLELLSSGEVLDRLRSRRLALEGRRESLDDSLAHSWSLLGPEPRAALRALAAFDAPLSTELAELVLDEAGAGERALLVLGELCDSSMVARDAGPEGPRVLLLASIQRFVRGRAEAEDDKPSDDELGRARLRALARFVQRWGRAGYGPQRARARRELLPHAPVLLATLREVGTLDEEMARVARRLLWSCRFLLPALAEPAELAGVLEGLLETLLARSHTGDDDDAALELRLVGTRHALAHEEPARARAHLDACPARAPVEGDLRPAERALLEGQLLIRTDHMGAAAAVLEAGRAALPPPGDDDDLRTSLEGWLAYSLARVKTTLVSLDEGEALYRQARACFERSGDVAGLAACLSGLAFLEQDKGDLASTERTLREALDAAEQAEERVLIGRLWGYLGNLRRREGKRRAAEVSYAEGQRLLARVGDVLWSAVFAMDHGILLVDRQDPAAALPVFERAVALAAQAGAPRVGGLSAAYLDGLRAWAGLPPAAGPSAREVLHDVDVPLFVELAAHFEHLAAFWRGEEGREALLAPWRSLGEQAATSQHAHYAHRLLGRVLAATEPPRGVLWVDLDEERFAWAGPSPQAFPGRSGAAAVLKALVRSHTDDAEAALPPEALFAAGWPGEKASLDAQKNRVRVAVAALRKAGLADTVETVAAGYRLVPDLEVVLATWRGPPSTR